MTFALIPPLEREGKKKLAKQERGEALAQRALADLDGFLAQRGYL